MVMGCPETLSGSKFRLVVMPTAGPWRILPHCLHSGPSFPLWGSPGLPPGAASPLLTSAFLRLLMRLVLCLSQCQASSGWEGVWRLGRAPMFRALPGQWPVDRGELSPSTDPAGLRAKRQLTSTHRQIQKDLKGHSAQPTVHGWVSERLRRRYRGRGLSSFLLLYSPLAFPRPCVRTEPGRPWGLGRGHRQGAPSLAKAPTWPEVAE